MTPTLERAARRAALGVVLALGGTLAVPGGAGPAAAATLIQSCPYTIIAPGLYVLARDLTCPGGDPAIRITADNVTLNLGGRTLTGDGGFGDGVLAANTGGNPTIEGLRVENGTVRGFEDGLDIRFAPGARVAGVTATDNRNNGILVVASPRARVESNTATGNGSDGIEAVFCDGCVLAGNRLVDNGDNGIELGAATGARVDGNTASGNGDDGIRLRSVQVDGNQVRGNTTNDNGGSGIVVTPGATGNRLEGNAANDNGTGFFGGVDLADYNLLADPCPNAWRGNRFATDNEGDGPGAGCIR